MANNKKHTMANKIKSNLKNVRLKKRKKAYLRM